MKKTILLRASTLLLSVSTLLLSASTLNADSMLGKCMKKRQVCFDNNKFDKNLCKNSKTPQTCVPNEMAKMRLRQRKCMDDNYHTKESEKVCSKFRDTTYFPYTLILMGFRR